MNSPAFNLIVLTILLSLFSCKSDEQDNREEMARRSSVKDFVSVSTFKLERTTFYHELVSNGKVNAKRSSDVSFRVDGTIKKIYVRNGEKVIKGQILAELEDLYYRIQYEKAIQQFERAEIEFKDDLITFHGRQDTIGISPEKLRISRIRSGIVDARTGKKEAEYNLTHTKIAAPISGVIANLEAKEWNPSLIYPNGLCKIIDNSVLEIKFPVLESEYGFVDIGMPVTVLPFIDDSNEYSGTITIINPVVDENGMVEVTAEMKDGAKLLEGMNVKVKIRKPVNDRLVIPKEALVIRQGRDVVFVREDTLAIWKYVTTEFENSESFSIKEGLQEGDLVIYKGNINLAHETVVKEEK